MVFGHCCGSWVVDESGCSLVVYQSGFRVVDVVDRQVVTLITLITFQLPKLREQLIPQLCRPLGQLTTIHRI